jgi:hypothetical protein
MSIGISSGINGTGNPSFWERLGSEIIATELDDSRVCELPDRFGNEWRVAFLLIHPHPWLSGAANVRRSKLGC